MNSTLKAICELLQSDNAEIQRAAALVLCNLNLKEPAVFRQAGEALAKCSNPEVIALLIRFLRQSPQEQNIAHLLAVIENPAVSQTEIVEAIAAVGPKAVGHLQRLYPKSNESTKLAIINALGHIRCDAALAFLVGLFFSKEAPAVREAIRTIRQNMAQLNKKDRLTLHALLKKAAGDKRVAGDELAASAILITLGITGEGKNKPLLLPYVDPARSRQLRRYALASLGQIEYHGDSNGDAIKALMTIVTDEQDEELVRLAVEALAKIPQRKSDADKLLALLNSDRPSCVHSFALRTLGRIDSSKNAKVILKYLTHKDLNLRAAVEDTLPYMNGAQQLLLESLEQCASAAEAECFLPALGKFKNRLSEKSVAELVRKLFSLLDKEDDRASVYLKALLAVDGEQLRASAVLRAANAQKSGNYAKVKESLSLLQDTEFLTDDLKYQLALAKIKSGGKASDGRHRGADQGLALVSELLAKSGKEFVRRFLDEKALTAEDYYYVGHHFLEKLNEERRFGADCLQHVIKKWKNAKIAKTAKNKLKEELKL